MNKLHLPTVEEVKKNLAAPTVYVHLELLPDTIREKSKEISQLEREARMLDTYFVKKGDKLC